MSEELDIKEQEGSDLLDSLKTFLEDLVPPKEVRVSDVLGNEYDIICSVSARKQIKILREFDKIEEMKGGLQAKKEEAEARILELEGKIRATDIGSFKFVARAFDSEVQTAEATENPVLIKEALDRAVNRVVKWFILILVLVFDPLAVTLVIAYNASLLRIKKGESEEVPSEEAIDEKKERGVRLANLPIFLIVIGIILYGLFFFKFMQNFSIHP